MGEPLLRHGVDIMNDNINICISYFGYSFFHTGYPTYMGRMNVVVYGHKQMFIVTSVLVYYEDGDYKK